MTEPTLSAIADEIERLMKEATPGPFIVSRCASPKESAGEITFDALRRDGKRKTMLDLRTERPEGLDIGVSFSAKRGNSWKWDGRDRWWEVTTTINGFNGAGGYWVAEEWRWNGSLHVLKKDIRSLSAEQSRALDAVFAAQHGGGG